MRAESTPSRDNDFNSGYRDGHRRHRDDHRCRLSIDGVIFYDTTDPASPQLLGSIDTPELANAVVVDGTRAYVADDLSGLQVIDISTPSSPEVWGA